MAATAWPVTLLLPVPGGALEAVVRTLAAPLSRHLGHEVRVETVAGDGGWAAIERLRSADPATTLLADADLTLALKQEVGGRGFSLEEVAPVAKLTDGFSVALIAPADSPRSSWDGLRRATASGTLSLASTGPYSATGVAERLLADVLATVFQEVRETGPAAIFAAVAEGRADLGLVPTNLIEGLNARSSGSKVVPVVTFGARRSPRYPETPAFPELSGDRHEDYTIALGLFGRADVPEAFAGAVLRALRAAETDPEIAAAPNREDFPIRVHDAEVLKQSVEREVRLLKLLQERELL